MIAILYKSGIPVNLTSVASNPMYDIEGFLVEFTFIDENGTNRYCFYSKSEFKKDDRLRSDLTDGFYAEDKFIKYIQDKDAGFNLGVPSSTDMIYKYKFDFTDFMAFITVNDSITVKLTDFDSPFDFFYNRVQYTFNFEYLPEKQIIKTYGEPILDGFNEIDYKLKIPIGATKTVTPAANQSTSAGFYFFQKNLGAFINTMNANPLEKRKLKKITLLIIFKIRYIIGNPNNNINGVIDGTIPNIMHNIGFTDNDLESLANSSNDINFENYETDPVDAIKKLIFLLKKSWGYYYVPGSTLPHRNEVPQIFNSTSSYSDFEYYYIGLDSFYTTMYREPISNIPDFLKFEMILQFLPINALSILPLPLFKDILVSFIKKRKLAEDEKRFVVRIVKSISITNANEFLDFLLESGDGIHTNYELIYYILGDARVEDYFLINNIADEIQTRKLYVFTILGLWKSSKYNFYFVPNGVIPLSENVNPNAFFIQNPSEFKEKNILTFISKVNPALGSNRVSFIDSTFEAKMSCDRIEITKVETKKNIYTNNLFVSATAAALSDGNPEKVIFGNFHLFHPIYLIGYKGNLELEMSDNNYVPAFLFQYIKEFDDIKDFDAFANLLIQIGLEIGLAYFTGGLSSLRHLNHLKHSYKIFQAMTNSALASEQILVFSGLESLTNSIAITGSIFFSYNNYLAATENDPALAERRAELSNILLYIVLASAAGSIAFRYKAVKAADDFLNTIPSGSIPIEIENLLISLRNQKALNILSIRQKIVDLQLETTNDILLKFDNFAADVKEALWTDFKNISLVDWKNLNQTNALALDRWKSLYDSAIIDRKFLNVVLSSNKTDTLITWYSYPQLKAVLEPLDSLERWIFLDKFGDEASEFFLKFLLKPEKISEYLMVDLAKRAMLIENKRFWLINDFDHITISKLQIHLEAAKSNSVRNAGGSQWFTDPGQKWRAERFLNDGGKWSNGELVEIPSQNYLKSIINSNEDVYLGVDIALYNNQGVRISARVQEIDGLLFNTNTGKVDRIISMKIDESRHSFTKDNTKLIILMKNLPDSGIEMKNYILNTPQLSKLPPKVINNAVEAKIIYTELMTGIEVKILPSEFSSKIKASYNAINDFQKIHPEILNTNKEVLIESSYQSIKNKF